MRPITFGDRADVKCVLENLCWTPKNVIIPVSEASDWASPLVVIRSVKSVKIRLCVDHTRLKKFVLRPTHPTRTPRNAMVEGDSECQYFTIFSRGQRILSDSPPSIQPVSDYVHDSLGAIQILSTTVEQTCHFSIIQHREGGRQRCCCLLCGVGAVLQAA